MNRNQLKERKTN